MGETWKSSTSTAAHEDPGKIINFLRFEARNYKVVKAAIKKSGFELLSAD
jgi:hypothetical protein